MARKWPTWHPKWLPDQLAGTGLPKDFLFKELKESCDPPPNYDPVTFSAGSINPFYSLLSGQYTSAFGFPSLPDNTTNDETDMAHTTKGADKRLALNDPGSRDEIRERCRPGERVRTNATLVAGLGYEWVEGTVRSVHDIGGLGGTVLDISLEDEGLTDNRGKAVVVPSGYAHLKSDYSRWIEFLIPEKAPTLTMETVVLEQPKKDLILKAISQVDNNGLIFDEWGFSEVFEKGTAVSLLFYGVPGTGKTLMAQAIANHVGQKLKVIQSGEIQSSEPGQAERNLKAFFEEAQKKGQVLLFDECDSLIADRNEVGMILGAQINALLTGLERYTGIAVFTTNRLGRMDPAFERRVSAKVEFPFPDEGQRAIIWKGLIPEKAPLGDDVDFRALAKYPLAGGNIKNVVLNAARDAAYAKKGRIDMACFQVAIEHEMEGIKSFEAAFAAQPQLPALHGKQTRRRHQEVGMENGSLSISRDVAIDRDAIRDKMFGKNRRDR